MVKGYEFAKDQYVTFTTDELKAMEEKATQTIDIAQFVPADKIDPVFFDKAYYLGPEKGGEKAYRLLAEVMRETKRVAVARYAARGKQYIVMLRAAEGAQGGSGIVMQTLLYGDEVRPFAEVPIGDATVREGELNLAKQLVDQLASDTFNPNDYEDDVRKRIQADIARKVQGQENAAPGPARRGRGTGGGQGRAAQARRQALTATVAATILAAPPPRHTAAPPRGVRAIIQHAREHRIQHAGRDGDVGPVARAPARVHQGGLAVPPAR